MLSTTDAIVLSLQPISDQAHILHAYTRTGGRVNYKVYGLGRKKNAGLYSPLALLQLTIDRHSIRTAQLSFVPTAITTDPYKRTVALFLGEVLYHVLRHPMPDEAMFDFLFNAIEALDKTDEPQNFHVHFLIAFAARLGFAMEETHPLFTTPTTRAERQEQLRGLCAYFAEHVETWESPRSLEILTEVFD